MLIRILKFRSYPLVFTIYGTLDELRNRIPLLRRRVQAHIAVGRRARPVLHDLDAADLGIAEQPAVGVAVDQHVEAGRSEVPVFIQRERGVIRRKGGGRKQQGKDYEISYAHVRSRGR